MDEGDDDLQAGIDYLLEQQGAAVFSVSDGHVLVLSETLLQELVAKAGASQERRVVVFIKRQAQA